MTTDNHDRFRGHQVRIALVRETAEGLFPPKFVKNSEDVAGLMRELGEKDREHFAVILLDTKNRVVGVAPLASGH